MQARALVKERPQRNLLLVIDGIKSEQMLLSHLAGITPADFQILRSLGLIGPLGTSHARASGATQPPSPRAAATSPPAPAAPNATEAPNAPTEPDEPDAPLDYNSFTATLTQLISKELGLRGFVLTLAVEKAGTIEELQAVAKRTIAQINDRKGEAAAAAARRALYGA